jgi:hypothetical protein
MFEVTPNSKDVVLLVGSTGVTDKRQSSLRPRCAGRTMFPRSPHVAGGSDLANDN